MSTTGVVALTLAIAVAGMMVLGSSWPFGLSLPASFIGADLAAALVGIIAAVVSAIVGLLVAAVAVVVSLLIAALVALPFLIVLALPLILVALVIYYAGKQSGKQASPVGKN